MNDEAKRHSHRLMMALMCVPVLLVVGIRIATDLVGFSAALTALACVAAMAVMSTQSRSPSRSRAHRPTIS